MGALRELMARLRARAFLAPARSDRLSLLVLASLANVLQRALPVVAAAPGVGTPASPEVALAEEHHEALAHWLLLIEEGRIEQAPHTILHIDSHADFGAPEGLSSLGRGRDAMTETTIKDFLAMAAWLGFVDEIVFLAPPWETQFRPSPGLMRNALEFVVGVIDEELQFATTPPPGTADWLDAILEGKVIPWRQRGELQNSTAFRFRCIAAEDALEFLASGALFAGKNHTRLLLDFDLDALSTTSPRALQITDRGLTEASLRQFHRLSSSLPENPVAVFEDAVRRHTADFERAPIPRPGQVRSIEHAEALAKEILKDTDEILPSTDLPPLEVLESSAAFCDGCRRAAQERVLAKHAKALNALCKEEEGGATEVAAWLEEALGQPFQPSTDEQIDVAVEFWGQVFEALRSSPPQVVTVVRSPFYSPRETVKRQECGIVQALRRVWPEARDIRMGAHVDVWHTDCPEMGATGAAAVQSWPVERVGEFHGARPTKEMWSRCIPARVSEAFSPATRRQADESDSSSMLVRFWNVNEGRGLLELFRREGKGTADTSLGEIAAGSNLPMDAFRGHHFVARCAEDDAAVLEIDDWEMTLTGDEDDVHISLPSCTSTRPASNADEL